MGALDDWRPVSPDDEAHANSGSGQLGITDSGERTKRGDDWLNPPAADPTGIQTQAFSDDGEQGPGSISEISVVRADTSIFKKDQVLDRYRLVRRLGSGAFAEVWLAVEDGNHGFRKEMALKLLKRDKADQETLTSLLDEARVCGMLQHPHLVDVYGVGICDGIAYIAMEYIRGTTLAALLHKLKSKGLQLPLSVTLDIGIQMCQGLEYAHAATDHNDEPLSLVHRDLKPANLMLSKRSGVKIADFGLAKTSTTSQSTEVGILRGTPGYIAPEIWGGSRDFGPHIDLFAVGAILWEMAVGSPLFRGSLPEVIGAAMHGAVSDDIQRLNLHQPLLAPVLEGLLQRDPDKRTSSAWTVQVALAELRENCFAPGGLSFFLSLVHEDFKAGDLPGQRGSSAALKATTDPQWLKLLDSHGSLLLKLDPSKMERRKARPKLADPGPTRAMSLPAGADEDTLDLRRKSPARGKRGPPEHDGEPAGAGTLWKAQVVDAASHRRPKYVALGALIAVLALGGMLYSTLQWHNEAPAEGSSTISSSEAMQPPRLAPEITKDGAASNLDIKTPAEPPSDGQVAVRPSATGKTTLTTQPQAKQKRAITAQPTPTAQPKAKPKAAAAALPPPSKRPAPTAQPKAQPKAAAAALPSPSKRPAAAIKAQAAGTEISTQIPSSKGCLVFRSSPSGAKVFLGRKDSGRFSSPRSKPVMLPAGRVMVHMDPGANLKLSTEALVTAGKRTTVTCNFKSGSCSLSTSDAACK